MSCIAGEGCNYKPLLPLDGSKGFEAIPNGQDEAYLETSEVDPRIQYHNDFTCFHDELNRNSFRKLVLARTIVEKKDEQMNPRDIFLKACEWYPRSYIALFYTAQTGMWLVASPEILLRGNATSYRTTAVSKFGCNRQPVVALLGSFQTIEFPLPHISSYQLKP